MFGCVRAMTESSEVHWTTAEPPACKGQRGRRWSPGQAESDSSARFRTRELAGRRPLDLCNGPDAAGRTSLRQEEHSQRDAPQDVRRQLVKPHAVKCADRLTKTRTRPSRIRVTNDVTGQLDEI